MFRGYIYLSSGTFIEFRRGMLNICPIGRNCSRPERNDFGAYDAKHKVRERMVKILQKQFKDYNLAFSIGGQISIDIFPTGWDKTYCLRHLQQFNFKEIHFFGDKAYPGGNDYEIYSHKDTIGHKVSSFHDTLDMVTKLWLQQADLL